MQLQPLIRLGLRFLGVIVLGIIIFGLWVVFLDRGWDWGLIIFIAMYFLLGWWFQMRWDRKKTEFHLLTRRLRLLEVSVSEIDKNSVLRNEIIAFAKHFSRKSNVALDYYASGKVKDLAIRIYGASIWLGAHDSFTCVQIVMEEQFSGWALVLPKSPILQKLSIEAELESNDFNRQTHLYSSTPKNAFALFSPDLMQWYLEQEYRPWIFIEQDRCTLIQPGKKTDEIPKTIEWYQELYKKILNSGALEKKIQNS